MLVSHEGPAIAVHDLWKRYGAHAAVRGIDLAGALAGGPELVFLDEPTTGFDPAARRRAWQVIRNLAAAGKTVVITTHYMEEAQTVCDRVALLVAGRIVAEGDPAELGSAV